jgi:hypothetical protein
LFGSTLSFPVVQNWIQNLPTEFNLFVAREQGRITQENIEDKPLIGLGAGINE